MIILSQALLNIVTSTNKSFMKRHIVTFYSSTVYTIFHFCLLSLKILSIQYITVDIKNVSINPATITDAIPAIVFIHPALCMNQVWFHLLFLLTNRDAIRNQNHRREVFCYNNKTYYY